MFRSRMGGRLATSSVVQHQEAPVQPSNNIAARAGRWSARHRKTAIIGWLTFVIAAFMIGGSLGTKELDTQHSGVGESGRAAEIVAKAFPDEKSGEQVLVQS